MKISNILGVGRRHWVAKKNRSLWQLNFFDRDEFAHLKVEEDIFLTTITITKFNKTKEFIRGKIRGKTKKNLLDR